MLAAPRLCASKGHHMMFLSLLGFYWFNFDAAKHTCHGQQYSGWVIKQLKQNIKCQFHVSALLLARFMLVIPQNPALCAYHLHYIHSICIGYALDQQSIITVSNHFIILSAAISCNMHHRYSGVVGTCKIPLLPTLDCIGVITVNWCVIVCGLVYYCDLYCYF